MIQESMLKSKQGSALQSKAQIKMKTEQSNELQFVTSSLDDDEFNAEQYEYRAAMNLSGPININDQATTDLYPGAAPPMFQQQHQEVQIVFDG